MVTAATMNEQHYKLLFDVRRSVRYHEQREGFLSLVSNFSKLLAFLLSSAAVFLLNQVISHSWPIWTMFFPLIVTILTGICLVFNVDGKAGLHAELKRRFIALEQKLVRIESELGDEAARANLDALQVERLIIESDEPPVLRVLDTLCYNEQIHAEGRGRKYLKEVTVPQRLFAHLFDVQKNKLYTTP